MTLPPTFRVAEAIDDAFERIQVDPKGITAEHVASVRRSIRLLLSEWNSDSVTFWKVQAGVQHVLTLNENQFVPPAGCLDILNAALKRDVYITTMIMLSREDWFNIPDKDTVKGMPNRFWTERNSVPPTVHIYPFAENSTDIIVYDAWMQFNDSTQLAGSADIPPRWEEAFTAGLTAKLAEKFNRALWAEKKMAAGGPMQSGGAYAIARAGDRERGDTVLVYQKSRRTRR